MILNRFLEGLGGAFWPPESFKNRVKIEIAISIAFGVDFDTIFNELSDANDRLSEKMSCSHKFTCASSEVSKTTVFYGWV